MKRLWNQSMKIAAITHAFLLALRNMASVDLFLPLRARRFREWYSIMGFIIQSPFAFVRRRRDAQSFAALNPDSVLSCFEIKVRIGIFFQNKLVSSALNTCSGRYSFSSMSWVS